MKVWDQLGEDQQTVTSVRVNCYVCAVCTRATEAHEVTTCQLHYTTTKWPTQPADCSWTYNLQTSCEAKVITITSSCHHPISSSSENTLVQLNRQQGINFTLKKVGETSPKDAICLLWIRRAARRIGNAISGSMKPVFPMCTSLSVVTVRPWCSHNSWASVTSSNASSRTSSVSGYCTALTIHIQHSTSPEFNSIYTLYSMRQIL